jgi:acetolactate synthase-1/2/3 large subunit
VNIVPGAGLTHALSGIAEAYMDGVPMLVLGCGIRRRTTHAYQLHDVDQLAIAAPVVKGTFRPETGAQLYPVLREACALARRGTPGPVMVEVSIDLYLTRHEVEPDAWGPAPAPAIPGASREEIARAAALLSAPGIKPLVYAGLGRREPPPSCWRWPNASRRRSRRPSRAKASFPNPIPCFSGTDSARRRLPSRATSRRGGTSPSRSAAGSARWAPGATDSRRPVR